jgi:hypothetical protein
MYWGAGAELGFLTVMGHVFFAVGAALVWRRRDEVAAWLQDAIGDMRRNMSRHAPIGPFYIPRLESGLKTIPSSFARTLSGIPRSPVSPAFVLVVLGPLLVILDFFV